MIPWKFWEEKRHEQHTVRDSVSAAADQTDEATERTIVEKEVIAVDENSQEETVKNQHADHSGQNLDELKEDDAP